MDSGKRPLAVLSTSGYKSVGVGSRKARRAAAKEARVDWRDVQRSHKAQEAALRLTPEKARELLARWAAERGHSQAEADRLNGAAND
jgi:hypothetical protein